MDEAASRVRLSGLVPPSELKDLEQKIEDVRREKEAATQNEEFEKAAALRDKEKALMEELERKRDEWKSSRTHREGNVTEDEIAEVVSSWTGVPVAKLAEDESRRLLNLEEVLHRRRSTR